MYMYIYIYIHTHIYIYIFNIYLGRRDWKAWRDRMARSNTTYKYYVNVLVFTVFISICFY